MKDVHPPHEDEPMTNLKTWVLLATYTNDSGDRMEFVLPEVSESDAAQVQAFLDHAYPGGGAVASIVGVESFTAFSESFDGEWEAFLAGAWKR